MVAPSRNVKAGHGTTSAHEIPDKLYFKIGEVAELVGVQTHVLRYWEKEIPFIRPTKTASNQRRYRRRDVEMFLEIRRLLHNERYTLAGARRRLMGGDRWQEGGGDEATTSPPVEKPRAAAPAPAPPSPPRASVAVAASPAAAAAAPKAPPVAQAQAGKPDRQLALGFAAVADDQRLSRVRARVKAGLEELIRLAGEEP